MAQTLPTFDEDAERIIFKAKESVGFISGSDLGDKDGIMDIFNQFSKNKLLTYGLIEKSETGSGYHLTKAGWNFKSFADEDAKLEMAQRKLKIDVENAERINLTYWWTFGFAVVGFAISLLLVILRIVERAD